MQTHVINTTTTVSIYITLLKEPLCRQCNYNTFLSRPNRFIAFAKYTNTRTGPSNISHQIHNTIQC